MEVVRSFHWTQGLLRWTPVEEERWMELTPHSKCKHLMFYLSTYLNERVIHVHLEWLTLFNNTRGTSFLSENLCEEVKRGQNVLWLQQVTESRGHCLLPDRRPPSPQRLLPPASWTPAGCDTAEWTIRRKMELLSEVDWEEIIHRRR